MTSDLAGPPARPSPWAAVARMERGVWAGLIRGVLRRPDIPPGGIGFSHHRALAPVRWLGFGVLAVEIVVVHLVVPSGPLRWILLVVGVYGAIWVAGYVLGAGAVRPHVVGPDVVLLRSGVSVEVRVPLAAVTQVRAVPRSRSGTSSVQVDGDVLHLVDNGGTGLDLVLAAPLTVSLPRRPAAVVTEIRVWVDDPAALATCIRHSVAEIAASGSAKNL